MPKNLIVSPILAHLTQICEFVSFTSTSSLTFFQVIIYAI